MKELSPAQLKELHRQRLLSKLRVIQAIKPYGELLKFQQQEEKYENLNVLSEPPTIAKLLNTNNKQGTLGRNASQEQNQLFNNLLAVANEEDADWLHEKIIDKLSTLDIQTINSFWNDILTKANKKFSKDANREVFYEFLVKEVREHNPLPVAPVVPPVAPIAPPVAPIAPPVPAPTTPPATPPAGPSPAGPSGAGPPVPPTPLPISSSSTSPPFDGRTTLFMSKWLVCYNIV